MKRKYIIIICSLVICLLVGILIYLFLTVDDKDSDGKKFKEEYSYIEIDEDNPFVYKSASDIVDLIKNKDTFLVYFGYPEDEKVKVLLPKIVSAINSNKIDKVYYVNLKKIRNEVIFNGTELETVKIGTQGYYDLLDILNDLLGNYNVKNDKGKNLDAGKRIEAPTVLAVVKGEATKLVDSRSKDFEEDLNGVINEIKLSSMCDEETAC